jgi:hypothetical protein
MSSIINNGQQNKGTGTVQTTTQIKVMAAAVKAHVTIPMYFYNIIVPQLDGYFDLYPVNFDNDPRACCPLHDEDTPSFRYYEDTQSFYCFGCAKGGNVINLHMYFAEKMNGKMPSKDEAIAFLYQYFVKGHESETFIDQKAQKIDKKERFNTDSEVVKFNIYRTNLENSITVDKNIKQEIKEQMWDVLDHIDMLLSKDLIKVDNAEEYIKQKVKELITVDASPQQHKLIQLGKTEGNMLYLRSNPSKR